MSGQRWVRSARRWWAAQHPTWREDLSEATFGVIVGFGLSAVFGLAVLEAAWILELHTT